MDTYVVKSVEPREGKRLRYLHQEVLDRECYIKELEPGQRATIMVKFDYDPQRFHRLHTSSVESVNDLENGGKEIVTLNTIYTLWPIQEASHE